MIRLCAFSRLYFSILFFEMFRELMIRLEHLHHPHISQMGRLVTDGGGPPVIESDFCITIMEHNHQNPDVNKFRQVILTHCILLYPQGADASLSKIQEFTSAMVYLHKEQISHKDLSPVSTLIMQKRR